MQERLPRSTGELLSDAMAVLRRHLKTYYLLALPFCAGELVLREAGQAALQTAMSRVGDPSKATLEQLAQALVGAAGGLGALLGSVILAQLLAAALIAHTRDAWDGQAPGVQRSLGVVLSRGAALLGTGLLFWMSIVGIFLLGGAAVFASVWVDKMATIGVAALALVGGVVALITLTLRWGLYAQTVVLEGRIGLSALTRSTALMAGRALPFLESPKFRLSIILIVTFAVAATMQSLFTIPRVVMAFASGWTITDDGLPPLAAMPIWFIVPFGLVEVATNSLVVPFSTVIVTLFYLDLRVRHEAIDLDPKVEAAPAPIGDPP